MRPFIVAGLVTLAFSCCCETLRAQANSQTTPSPSTPARTHYWWHDQAPGAGHGAANRSAVKMPLISVKGNRFVDPEGKPVLFRGPVHFGPRQDPDARALE